MSNFKKSKIIVILGPTSSGKSEIAIKLAKKINGEIISADSRQIYRGMDIGTGKEPGRWDQGKKAYISSGVPHYMIDTISPKTNFSAAQFKKRADKIIPNIIKRGRIPILCGGTGFWIKAIVDNIVYPEVKPDPVLRKNLRDKTAKELFTMLEKLDPERAKNIDAKNPARLIRAIEICKTLGKVPAITGSPTSSKEVGLPKYDFLQIGISLPKKKLRENIRKRLKQRFKQGMIKEVEKLHSKDKISWKRLESFGLGYKLIPLYLKKEIATTEELFEKIYQAEKDYAKRQMTWFGKDKRIDWFKNYQEIESAVKNFLKK